MAARLVFLGPPGAGKGTQAVKIAGHLNIPHISTGDILRGEVKSNSKLGQKVGSYLQSGALVPDNIILDVVEERISKPDCQAGFLFDGFPRTIVQAEGLDSILKRLQKPLTRVVHLKVPDEVVTARIIERGKSSGRQDDLKPEVIEHRLSVFKGETEPLARYYQDLGLLVDVDGRGPIGEVSDRIIAELS